MGSPDAARMINKAVTALSQWVRENNLILNTGKTQRAFSARVQFVSVLRRYDSTRGYENRILVYIRSTYNIRFYITSC